MLKKRTTSTQPWHSHFLSVWLLLLGLCLTSSWALQNIHDTRYTHGPEIMIPNQSELSAGFMSHWQADGDLFGSFKFGITDRVEVGSRLTWETENHLDNHYLMLDLGAKYKWSAHEALQIDLLAGVNNSHGGGLALGYTWIQSYTTWFGALYELRTGFWDALAHGNYAVIQYGAFPYFRVVHGLKIDVGLVTSSFVRHPIDSFQIDLIPGFSAGIAKHIRLQSDCAVGIMGSHDFRLALRVITMF